MSNLSNSAIFVVVLMLFNEFMLYYGQQQARKKAIKEGKLEEFENKLQENKASRQVLHWAAILLYVFAAWCILNSMYLKQTISLSPYVPSQQVFMNRDAYPDGGYQYDPSVSCYIDVIPDSQFAILYWIPDSITKKDRRYDVIDVSKKKLVASFYENLSNSNHLNNQNVPFESLYIETIFQDEQKPCFVVTRNAAEPLAAWAGWLGFLTLHNVSGMQRGVDTWLLFPDRVPERVNIYLSLNNPGHWSTSQSLRLTHSALEEYDLTTEGVVLRRRWSAGQYKEQVDFTDGSYHQGTQVVADGFSLSLSKRGYVIAFCSRPGIEATKLFTQDEFFALIPKEIRRPKLEDFILPPPTAEEINRSEELIARMTDEARARIEERRAKFGNVKPATIIAEHLFKSFMREPPHFYRLTHEPEGPFWAYMDMPGYPIFKIDPSQLDKGKVQDVFQYVGCGGKNKPYAVVENGNSLLLSKASGAFYKNSSGFLYSLLMGSDIEYAVADDEGHFSGEHKTIMNEAFFQLNLENGFRIPQGRTPFKDGRFPVFYHGNLYTVCWDGTGLKKVFPNEDEQSERR